MMHLKPNRHTVPKRAADGLGLEKACSLSFCMPVAASGTLTLQLAYPLPTPPVTDTHKPDQQCDALETALATVRA